MKQVLFLVNFFLFLFLSCSQAQEPSKRPHCKDAAFDKAVCKSISFSVPLIGVEELKQVQEEVLIFDTRKKEEYEVSHIPNAKYLGYKEFDPTLLKNIAKDKKIVLYCSIGYRSEKIGEKLLDMGYTNVYNLYGSIFEWINQGNAVVDQHNKITKEVHTYNWVWSKWVDEKKAKKTW